MVIDYKVVYCDWLAKYDTDPVAYACFDGYEWFCMSCGDIGHKEISNE